MRGLLGQTDLLLRTGTVSSPERSRAGVGLLLGMIAAFGLAYGAAMGAFSAGTWPRGLQMLYSGLKVPLLLLATFALSLPNYFVLNSLLGLRQDFAAAVRALLATQAGLTAVLCALAPFTLVWYASVENYQAAVLFNAAMFAGASGTAQVLLRRFYRPLIQRDPRHRLLLRLWLVIYAFVGIQMGWLLRPFIGDPHLPTRFLRADTWGNAYVVVARMVWEVVRGQ